MKKLLNRLTPKNVGLLILEIVIFILIPYLYLIACGFIFDKWLHMYNMTVFIFFSLMFLWLIALILSVLVIISFVKSKKNPETFAANRAAYTAKKEAKKAEKAAKKAAEMAEKEAAKAAMEAAKAAEEQAASEAAPEEAKPEEEVKSEE